MSEFQRMFMGNIVVYNPKIICYTGSEVALGPACIQTLPTQDSAKILTRLSGDSPLVRRPV
jgi:hypothetical protein